MAIIIVRIVRLVIFFLGVNLVMIVPAFSNAVKEPPRHYNYQIVREFPHDSEAYTQGLAYDQGIVYEGTGLYGKSSLRQVNLRTGRVERLHEHEEEIFGEGITIFEDRVFQLTWKNYLLFEYNRDDFSLRRTWSTARQGWGITHDGEHLIVSNGSATLYFLNPTTMEEDHAVMVHDHNGPVRKLNELEYVKGRIYANIYQQDRIAIIDPADGYVSGYLDLSELSAQFRKERKAAVLNGIMYDSINDRLFVTGKLWPSLFEIRLIP